MDASLPAYFLSHGGGPWPWMKKEFGATFDALEASLKDIPRQIGTVPKAVLMISGHWEEKDFTLQANLRPPMIYDFGGFPPHTYRIQYSAPGSPELASRARDLLTGAGLTAALDTQRGYDHGTYAPMAAIYPDADVPVVQLSLRSSLDPAAHMAAGRALAPLRKEGILILGSGLSWHNLRMMGPEAKAPSQALDDWLNETLLRSPPEERLKRMMEWAKAPAARLAHPREDHFIPIMTAMGAAEGEPIARVYHEEGFFGGTTVSSFRFGKTP
ncbi:MAG: Extradiol ring-cleavage dioxygenase class protein subunit [Fibrobacteres bacterium]|nr:Extradiol ring-cleavage dioxygenase class protein subunit [Fibrobacterota bacterium]